MVLLSVTYNNGPTLLITLLVQIDIHLLPFSIKLFIDIHWLLVLVLYLIYLCGSCHVDAPGS